MLVEANPDPTSQGDTSGGLEEKLPFDPTFIRLPTLGVKREPGPPFASGRSDTASLLPLMKCHQKKPVDIQESYKMQGFIT